MSHGFNEECQSRHGKKPALVTGGGTRRHLRTTYFDTPDRRLLAAELALLEPRPVVVLTSSREANSYGELLRSAPVRGFIAKRELSGEALATMV